MLIGIETYKIQSTLLSVHVYTHCSEKKYIKFLLEIDFERLFKETIE